MKRALCLALVPALLLACLPLCGCGSLYANYREVEQLRVMQTLGLDPAPGGVAVTLAAAADRGGSASVCFTGRGESVSTAIEAARAHSAEEDLFTGHLRHVLIGEEAARQGLEPFLSYICRSPDMRMDMPLFVLLGSTAQEAMSAAGDPDRGVAEQLQAAQTKLEAQSGKHIFTAAEILRSLESSGSALVHALRCDTASEADGEASAGNQGGETPQMTVTPGGFAVIKDGRLCEAIDPDAALGVDFLINSVGIRDLVVRDRFGLPATLEINRGGTRIHPLWAQDGSLRGIEIYATVYATLLETESSNLSAVENADYLTGQLEAAVSDRIGAVLWLARTLEADFLGLGAKVEQASPLEYRRMGQALGPLLPSLELSIAVQGELRHSHDLE